MKFTLAAIGLAILVFLGGVFLFLRENTNLQPVILPPPGDITEILNTTGMPLILPEGFSINVFAKDLTAPRVMVHDLGQNIIVSIPQEGKVVVLHDENKDGVADETIPLLSGLKRPHGLAFRCFGEKVGCQLFVAEENAITSYTYFGGKGYTKAENPQKILDLPSGGNHTTRTIGWLPGSDFTKLLISVGSTCNVCNEEDSRRAKMFVYDLTTKELKEFARGLRNSVFFAPNIFGEGVFATEMGRDLLGDDTPPDEVNIIEEGKNYGWPICYGKNIHDTNFDKNVYIRNPCMAPFETPSHIDIPAHSAPLGLAFVPEGKSWPKEYEGDLLVAYHGSWNRKVPTGYKIVRMKLDEKGQHLGTEDFISGWLTPDGALGRPVDLKFGLDGTLYVSDDKAGVIYRIIH